MGVIEGNEKWTVYSTRDYGYPYMHGRPSRRAPESGDPVVGVKSMDVHLGSYRTIFITDVIAFFAFDEDSKLVDIAILKDMDAM